MSAHTSPTRSGTSTVRANFAKTPAQIAAIEKQRKDTARLIADHRVAMEARGITPVKVTSGHRAWTPTAIAELRHIRLGLQFTAGQIARYFGITACSASSAIGRHCKRPGEAAPKKANMRKPAIEAALVNEKIERKCLQCNKAFVAPHRFKRLCRPDCQGGSESWK